LHDQAEVCIVYLSMERHIDDQFSLDRNIIYLNHAGVAPWPVRTAAAVKAFADENAVRGAFDYPRWLRTEIELRLRLQTLLNAASTDDIALVKNTSEALSFVAYGLKWKRGENIVSTNQEFPSNRIVWQSLADKGVEFREADLRNNSSPEESIFSLVDSKTRLITVSSVQFGTGLRLDLARIGEFCKRRKILFCVDAIQSLGAVAFDVQAIQADFVMADGHKWMLGPEGLGVFYSSPEARDRLRLHEYGWNMVRDAGNFDAREWTIAKSARRFECGSPNMLGVYALNASLSLLLETGMQRVEEEVLENSSFLFEQIRSSGLDLITDDSPGRYAGIVTFGVPGIKGSQLYDHLMAKDVFCANRSGGVRFSPHFYTPREDLRKALEIVVEYKP
jgi:cysteine desulfurase/selenocysteine lyase